MGRRGFSLIELLIASVVAAIALGAFLTVLRSGYQHSAQTRYRTVATILAQTLVEDVIAHPYGELPPPRWQESTAETPTQIWIQGRPMQMAFKKQFSYRNSSFIDQSVDQDWDVVTIQITWSEAVGNNNAEKLLTVEVPVWR